MKELVIALMLWITNNSEYTMVTEYPEVKLALDLCAAMGFPTRRACPYGGRYYPETRTILLDGAQWEMKEPYSEALLVHELTHYFQDLNWEGGLHDDVHPSLRCKAAKEAYDLQAKYLYIKHNIDMRGAVYTSIERTCKSAWFRWRRKNFDPSSGI